MEVKHHVTGGVSDGGVWLVRSIIQEPYGCVTSFLHSFRLLGSNVANDKEHGRVDSDSLVEESANYLIHEVGGFGRQKELILVLVGILDGSAIDGLVPGMRGVLGEGGGWILGLLEGFLGVCGHGYVTSPFFLVTIKGETTIKGASPVDRDSIHLLESLDEIVSSFSAAWLTTSVSNTLAKKLLTISSRLSRRCMLSPSTGLAP